MLAPGTTTMLFSPRLTTIWAMPVGASAVRRTPEVSTPSARITSRNRSPNASAPTQPIIATRAPSRAAATAWFNPLPPGSVWNAEPMTVSPARGRDGASATRSMFRLPATTTRPLIASARAPSRD